jgi:hypothetical protein
LRDDPTPDPAPDGRVDYGTLGLRVHLAPGERAELPVVLTWHTPNLTNTWNAGWRSLESLVGKQDGFEGCFDNIGSCPMNCTHVWNYEQSLAYLYPAFERGVRDTDFKVNTREDGDTLAAHLQSTGAGVAVVLAQEAVINIGQTLEILLN